MGDKVLGKQLQRMDTQKFIQANNEVLQRNFEGIDQLDRDADDVHKQFQIAAQLADETSETIVRINDALVDTKVSTEQAALQAKSANDFNKNPNKLGFSKTSNKPSGAIGAKGTAVLFAVTTTV